MNRLMCHGLLLVWLAMGIPVPGIGETVKKEASFQDALPCQVGDTLDKVQKALGFADPTILALTEPQQKSFLEWEKAHPKLKISDSIISTNGDKARGIQLFFTHRGGSDSLQIKLKEGIRIFFNDTNAGKRDQKPFFNLEENLKLPADTVRVDSPFSGKIEGIRIGDNLDVLQKAKGKPLKDPWEFGGNQAWLYPASLPGTIVRFDVTPAGTVESIFLMKQKTAP